MENFNILSAWWFMFFLLILVIGYFIVEVLLWDKYFLKKVLERNENHVLDRVIHYVIWWIIWNILFYLLLHYTNSNTPLLQIFDNTIPMAIEMNKLFWINALSYQIIYFSIFYLWFFILVTSVIRFCIPYSIIQSIKNYKMIRGIIDDNRKKKIKRNKKPKKSS